MPDYTMGTPKWSQEPEPHPLNKDIACMPLAQHHATHKLQGCRGLTWTPLLGMGRLSFISATPGGKSFLYQGCRWMSGMLMRRAGSGTRMRFSRSLHSREALTWGGNSYSTFKILCRAGRAVSRLYEAAHGTEPTDAAVVA